LVFPLIVYYFHKVPLVFIPSSLIAVPAAYLIILMGIVLFLTHMISTFVSAITAFLLSSVLQFLNLGIAYLNELPFASFHEIGISSLVLSLYYIFIIFVMRFIYTMRIKWLIPALGVCLFLIVSLYQDSYIKSNSKTLVSYDLYGASLVDFFEDRNNFFVQSKETNSSYIEYASQGNRIAGGVKNNINISDCDFYSTPGFRKNKTLYQLDDNIISMPNQTDFIVDDRISVYILNHGFAKNRAYQKLSEIHPTSKVVFDKSVRPWNKEKYLLLINESQVHDIYKEGAFVLSF